MQAPIPNPEAIFNWLITSCRRKTIFSNRVWLGISKPHLRKGPIPNSKLVYLESFYLIIFSLGFLFLILQVFCFYYNFLFCVHGFLSLCVSFCSFFSSYFLLFLFWFVWGLCFNFVVVACLFSNERRKEYGFGLIMKWEGLGRTWGEETVTRIYCMKKMYF